MRKQQKRSIRKLDVRIQGPHREDGEQNHKGRDVLYPWDMETFRMKGIERGGG